MEVKCTLRLLLSKAAGTLHPGNNAQRTVVKAAVPDRVQMRAEVERPGAALGGREHAVEIAHAVPSDDQPAPAHIFHQLLRRLVIFRGKQQPIARSVLAPAHAADIQQMFPDRVQIHTQLLYRVNALSERTD